MIEDNRYGWIDSLKGIAMCGVIMIHSGGSDMPSIIGRIGNIGQYGVQMFLLISAFLGYVSYEKYILNHTSDIKWKDNVYWWIKKIIKLIPLYYLAIIVYTVFVGGENYWLGSEGYVTVKNVLAHIFFLHGLFPHYADSILGVEWYLGILVIFYVSIPLLYRFVNSIEKGVIFFVGAIVTCYCINKIAVYFFPNVGDIYIYIKIM